MTAANNPPDALLIQAIKDALHLRNRKHLEIWKTVSSRYPSVTYDRFDRMMGKLEMDDVITLTGSRGPNTYKLSLSPNARREEPDTTAARELSLYIENEYALVGAPNSQGKAIEKNLLSKIRNGTFDLEKSEIAWMHLMETGAKRYAKEHGDGEHAWSRMFNKPTRELVAHEFATTFYEENKGSH